MVTQAYIYYQVPAGEKELALQCARLLMTNLNQSGLGQGRLYLRDESEKSRITLMEVFTPPPGLCGQGELCDQWVEQIQALAARCFSPFANPPLRHVEMFTEIQ